MLVASDTKTESIYSKCDRNRKQWQPIEPKQKEYCVSGSTDTLNRCLALRVLEIPVKEFVLDGISRSDNVKLHPDAIPALLKNTEDEEKHDIAFNNCAKVFADYNLDYDSEALAIKKEWFALNDHPITKVAVIENALFFVMLPLFRRFGGEALRVTSIDVSFDEQGHSRCHRQAARELNQKPSKTLDNLRKQTVAWLLEKFEVEDFTKEQFLRASDDLMYRGVSKEMDFTKTFSTPAFFEKRNDQLPYYLN